MEEFGMEMPCRCEFCGTCFDLNDGFISEKWSENSMICETCKEEENQEIEREERISELELEIEEVENCLRDWKRELKLLKAKG